MSGPYTEGWPKYAKHAGEAFYDGTIRPDLKVVPLSDAERMLAEIRKEHAEKIAIAPGLECTCEFCNPERGK